MRRILVLLATVALIAVACGDDAATDTSELTTDPDVTVPDVVGQTTDFARGALEAVGLRPDVVEVESAGSEAGTVIEQVPEAGATAGFGATVILRVAVGSEETTTTTAAAADDSSTTTAVGGSTTTTTSGDTTTTTAGTTTTTAATTTTAEAGLTQEQCEDHPYYEPRSDPNCGKAEYRLVVNNTTSPRVWQCMSMGDGVSYNPDQPGNLQCIQDRNAPNLYFQSNPPAPPYPDYDPTIGTVDTYIECSWKDAQYILDRVDNLTQGSPNLQDGWQWIVSTSNEVCAGR